MRPPILPILALAALAAAGCGEGGEMNPDPEATPETIPEGAASAPVPENPGLPTATSDFVSASEQAPDVEGRLWVTTTPPELPPLGFSLVAQLRNLPRSQAFAWAIHEGDCGAPPEIVLPLGWGVRASDQLEGRPAERGGPLGEMRLAFQATEDGRGESAIWVPFDEIERERLEARPHSVRIHPPYRGESFGPAVACAPLPELPDAERGGARSR